MARPRSSRAERVRGPRLRRLARPPSPSTPRSWSRVRDPDTRSSGRPRRASRTSSVPGDPSSSTIRSSARRISSSAEARSSSTSRSRSTEWGSSTSSPAGFTLPRSATGHSGSSTASSRALLPPRVPRPAPRGGPPGAGRRRAAARGVTPHLQHVLRRRAAAGGGPLRFGLPLLPLLGRRDRAAPHAAACSPGCGAGGDRPRGLGDLGARGAWLHGTDVRRDRRRTSGSRPGASSPRDGLSAGLAACVAAHVAACLGTLIGSGGSPHWGQYLGYAHAFLFGGGAGSISYGFADCSPDLRSTRGRSLLRALILLLRRRPDIARQDPEAARCAGRQHGVRRRDAQLHG